MHREIRKKKIREIYFVLSTKEVIGHLGENSFIGEVWERPGCRG